MSVHVVSQSGNPSDDTRRVGTGFHSESRGKFRHSCFAGSCPQWEIDQGLLASLGICAKWSSAHPKSFLVQKSHPKVTCNSAFLSMEKNHCGIARLAKGGRFVRIWSVPHCRADPAPNTGREAPTALGHLVKPGLTKARLSQEVFPQARNSQSYPPAGPNRGGDPFLLVWQR